MLALTRLDGKVDPLRQKALRALCGLQRARLDADHLPEGRHARLERAARCEIVGLPLRERRLRLGDVRRGRLANGRERARLFDLLPEHFDVVGAQVTDQTAVEVGRRGAHALAVHRLCNDLGAVGRLLDRRLLDFTISFSFLI